MKQRRHSRLKNWRTKRIHSEQDLRGPGEKSGDIGDFADDGIWFSESESEETKDIKWLPRRGKM